MQVAQIGILWGERQGGIQGLLRPFRFTLLNGHFGNQGLQPDALGGVANQWTIGQRLQGGVGALMLVRHGLHTGLT